MAAPAKVEQTDAQRDAAIWHRWKSELDYALKDKEYKAWVERSEKIVKRYRDQRPDTVTSKRRLNILWSNVQTLKPAVLAKPPKALAERRFLDRDPVGRLASMIMERCLNNQIEQGNLFESAQQGVDDHLLVGMGVIWPRYEPQFEQEAAANSNVKAKSADDVEEEGDGSSYEKVASERVCVDYVFWKDLCWGPARFWNERPWVARRCWKTHSEIAQEYYKGDMAKAKKITLDYSPNKDATDEQTVGYFKKAEIWQFWNFADHTVYDIPPGTPDIVLRKEKDPVLKLEGFIPMAKPAFATQTNETIVPVPDYVQYQDQAQELDDLTNRIAALTTALRVSGVYDASFPALARLLQDGEDNKLIPVDQWAMFAEKGGIPGAVSFVPLKEMADTLIGLYSARQQVKSDLYEVTGMSDIIRGQGEQQETATAQRIKGQFASMRLEDRRGVINAWLLATIKIMGEIIVEMFSEDTLLKMSGMDLKIADDVRKAVEKIPPPPEPEPPQPQEGMAPPDPQQVQMAMEQAKAQGQAVFQQMQQQVAAQTQAHGMKEFQEAVALLKSDKLRGFRIDIETDSTIVADAQADREGANELVRGVLEALTAAGPIVQMAPELMGPIGDLIMFAYRKNRVGRAAEAGLEDALDQMKDKVEAAKNQPPPPSPEQIKAEADAAAIKATTEAKLAETQAKSAADQQKQQAENERENQRFAMEQQTNAAKMAMAREQHAMDMQRMEAERINAERDRAAQQDDRQFQRQQAEEQQGFKREAHQQAMQKVSTESNAKRTEAGLPGDEAWNALAQEMKDAREASMEEIKVLAEAIKAQGEATAAALSADKEIQTPDGRTFTSRVKRGGNN